MKKKLLEEFMKPMGIFQNALAIALHVPATRIGEIVNERRGISADTALRLAKYFNTTSDFWMNLQTNYDLKIALKEKESVNQHPMQENINAHGCTNKEREYAKRSPVR